MDASELYDYEGRTYLNPTLSRDEQLSFVDTLRDTMGRNTAQINAQTQTLGTNVPSNLGGLTGANSYFTQRYQTLPVEERANALKATAQAKALNDLMSNYEKQWKNRATQAYRNAARSAASSSGGSGGNGGAYIEAPEAFDQISELSISQGAGEPSTWTTTGIDNDYYYTRTANGKLYSTNDPNYYQGQDGNYYSKDRVVAAANQKIDNLTKLNNALNLVMPLGQTYRNAALSLVKNKVRSWRYGE